MTTTRTAISMTVALVALVGATISARAETAPVKCPTGYQNSAGICVSQRMADYLACLRELKGGRLRVTRDHSDSTPSGLIVEVGGGVRGIASGRVKVDTKQEKKTIDKLEETFSPDGVSGCIKNAVTPPSSGRPPGKHHPPPEGEKAPRTPVDPTDQEIRLLLQQGGDQERVGTPDSLQAARTLYSSAYETSGRKSTEAAGSLGLVFGKLCAITSLEEHVGYCEKSSYFLQKALDDATDPWVKRHRGTLEDAKERVNKAPVAHDAGAGHTSQTAESEQDKVRSLIENGRDQEFRGFDAAAADLYRRALDTSQGKSAEAAGLLGLVQTKLCRAIKGSKRHRCFGEAASHLRQALYGVNVDQWVTGSQSLLQETWDRATRESDETGAGPIQGAPKDPKDPDPPPGGRPTQEISRPSNQSPPVWWRRPSTILLATGTAAALTAGVIFAHLTSQTDGYAQPCRDVPASCDNTRRKQLNADGPKYQKLQWILFGSAACGAAGLVYWLYSGRRHASATVAPAAHGLTMMASGAF